MSLLQQIKDQQLAARLKKDALASALLTTLYSEAQMVGKNKGQETTDDEVIAVVRKFLKGVNETLEALRGSINRQDDARCTTALREKEILESYLPQSPDRASMVAALQEVLASDSKAPNIGLLMGVLTKKFGAALNKAEASALAKDWIEGRRE